MPNKEEAFLKVYKSWYAIEDLSTLQIFIGATVEEFQRNGKDCYITDATFAKDFHTSEKTISRAIKDMCDKGILTKEVRTVASRRVRTLKVQRDKMTVSEEVKGSICPSESVNLSNPDGQNDFKKENIKEKENIKDGELTFCSIEDANRIVNGYIVVEIRPEGTVIEVKDTKKRFILKN